MNAIFVMTSVLVLEALVTPQFDALQSDEQLFAPNALTAIRTRAGKERLVWPRPGEAVFVAKDRLPGTVMGEVNAWIDRTLKIQLPVPARREYVGLRSEVFDDAVALRVAVPGAKVQIIDCPDILYVVIKDRSYSFDRDDNVPEVRRAIAEFLRVPAGRLADAKFYTGMRRESDGPELFAGSVEMETEGKSVEWLKWWNRFWFIADGSTIAFTLRKTEGDGKVGTNNGKGPALPSRFGAID